MRSKRPGGGGSSRLCASEADRRRELRLRPANPRRLCVEPAHHLRRPAGRAGPRTASRQPLARARDRAARDVGAEDVDRPARPSAASARRTASPANRPPARSSSPRTRCAAGGARPRVSREPRQRRSRAEFEGGAVAEEKGLVVEQGVDDVVGERRRCGRRERERRARRALADAVLAKQRLQRGLDPPAPAVASCWPVRASSRPRETAPRASLMSMRRASAPARRSRAARSAGGIDARRRARHRRPRPACPRRPSSPRSCDQRPRRPRRPARRRRRRPSRPMPLSTTPSPRFAVDSRDRVRASDRPTACSRWPTGSRSSRTLDAAAVPLEPQMGVARREQDLAGAQRACHPARPPARPSRQLGELAARRAA